MIHMFLKSNLFGPFAGGFIYLFTPIDWPLKKNFAAYNLPWKENLLNFLSVLQEYWLVKEVANWQRK